MQPCIRSCTGLLVHRGWGQAHAGQVEAVQVVGLIAHVREAASLAQDDASVTCVAGRDGWVALLRWLAWPDGIAVVGVTNRSDQVEVNVGRRLDAVRASRLNAMVQDVAGMSGMGRYMVLGGCKSDVFPLPVLSGQGEMPNTSLIQTRPEGRC